LLNLGAYSNFVCSSMYCQFTVLCAEFLNKHTVETDFVTRILKTVRGRDRTVAAVKRVNIVLSLPTAITTIPRSGDQLCRTMRGCASSTPVMARLLNNATASARKPLYYIRLTRTCRCADHRMSVRLLKIFINHNKIWQPRWEKAVN